MFAKWPAPGRVKTRLSPALPPALACDLYRALLHDTLSAAAGADAGERFVYWAGAPADRDAVALPAGFAAREQRGADLGSRLGSAFDELLAGPGDRAAIVGADCPALGAPELRAAFAALAAHDLVLGPTRDGGYYLVGLARRAPAIFEGIEWSTARVLGQTLERARASALRVHLLPQLDDLDTPEDLVRWLAESVTRAAPAPSRTRRLLRSLGLLPDRAGVQTGAE